MGQEADQETAHHVCGTLTLYFIDGRWPAGHNLEGRLRRRRCPRSATAPSWPRQAPPGWRRP